jgi:hypothetical protein
VAETAPPEAAASLSRRRWQHGRTQLQHDTNAMSHPKMPMPTMTKNIVGVNVI